MLPPFTAYTAITQPSLAVTVFGKRVAMGWRQMTVANLRELEAGDIIRLQDRDYAARYHYYVVGGSVAEKEPGAHSDLWQLSLSWAYLGHFGKWISDHDFNQRVTEDLEYRPVTLAFEGFTPYEMKRLPV